MRALLSAVLATALTVAVGAKTNSDDLVLELTTKLGVEKTVTVTSVQSGNALERDSASGLGRVFPQKMIANDKKYLALSPSPVAPSFYPAMLIAIPWENVKEVSAEKAASAVTCLDGAKFTGTILTEVTSTDGLKYHLASLQTMTVKAVTKSEQKDVGGPAANCTVHFGNFTQSFEANRLSFQQGFEMTQKFEMRVGGEVIAGNLSEFEKVTLKGSQTGPTRITVRAPKGKETEGELIGNQQMSLICYGPNDCSATTCSPL